MMLGSVFDCYAIHMGINHMASIWESVPFIQLVPSLAICMSWVDKMMIVGEAQACLLQSQVRLQRSNFVLYL